MKNIFLILLLLPLFALAQTKPLVLQGSGADQYLVHTTGPKESFYSIGRIYNISPKIMAPYNRLELEKGLTIGQQVRIPLNEVNFYQGSEVESDIVLIPLYHVVKPKENLNNLGTPVSKVPARTLVKWNKLRSETIAPGSKLIVGFLMVKKDLSPLVANAADYAWVTKEETVTSNEKKDPVSSDIVKKSEMPSAPVIKEKPKEMPAPVEVVKAAPPVVKTVVPVVKEPAPDRQGGVFKGLFQKQMGNRTLKEEQGEAGVFKSTSGWDDGKYYCLQNTALAGTVIKITNPVNQKFVYAKVLDVIPDIKQNDGILIRLSNAAASELGVLTDNFTCVLNY